jgi:hypothetical protein
VLKTNKIAEKRNLNKKIRKNLSKTKRSFHQKERIMNKYFSIFFVFIALASCSKEGEAIQMTEVNNKWNKNQEQKFVLNIDDTQNPKHHFCSKK